MSATPSQPLRRPARERWWAAVVLGAGGHLAGGLLDFGEGLARWGLVLAARRLRQSRRKIGQRPSTPRSSRSPSDANSSPEPTTVP